MMQMTKRPSCSTILGHEIIACGSHPLSSQVPFLSGAGRGRFQTQNPEFVGSPSGFAVGGCTPQFVQSTAYVVIQGLQEQVQFQGRMNPSMFGQVPFSLPVDVSVPQNPGSV